MVDQSLSSMTTRIILGMDLVCLSLPGQLSPPNHHSLHHLPLLLGIFLIILIIPIFTTFLYNLKMEVLSFDCVTSNRRQLYRPPPSNNLELSGQCIQYICYTLRQTWLTKSSFFLAPVSKFWSRDILIHNVHTVLRHCARSYLGYKFPDN